MIAEDRLWLMAELEFSTWIPLQVEECTIGQLAACICPCPRLVPEVTNFSPETYMAITLVQTWNQNTERRNGLSLLRKRPRGRCPPRQMAQIQVFFVFNSLLRLSFCRQYLCTTWCIICGLAVFMRHWVLGRGSILGCEKLSSFSIIFEFIDGEKYGLGFWVKSFLYVIMEEKRAVSCGFL